MSDVVEISVAAITPGDNDRTTFDETKLAELADSIRRHGLAQPIILRPLGDGYQIVAGERRWRAVCRLGWATVPAIVRAYDDRQAAAVMLAENTARADLDPLDEADAYAKRVSDGWTVGEIARAGGVAPSRVSAHIAVAGLSSEARSLIRSRNLSVTAAQWLVGLDDNRQHLAVAALVGGDLSAAQLGRVCQRLRQEQDQDSLFGDDFMRVETFDTGALFDVEERAAELAAEAQATCRFGALGEARVMIEQLMADHPDAALVAEAGMLLERLNGRPAVRT